MKKLLFLILSALTAAGIYAQDSIPAASTDAATSAAADAEPVNTLEKNADTPAVGNLAQQADSAYAQDNFTLAEQLYLESIRQDGTSSTVFYNLGNAYYRQGNLGKAILNYERALKLDPTNADAQDNLAFVKSKITDRQTEDSSLITAFWNSVVTMFKANTWAWISVVLFALLLSGILVYVFSSVIAIKKFSFFGAIVIFFLCTAGIIISFAAANRTTDNSRAIILPPSAQLSTTPREARTQAEEAFLLHEGTAVEIIDSVSSASEGKWYEVAVGTGERAWIKASDLERI